MIQTPTFLVDEEKCKINIRAMAAKAKRNNVIFRPHFKTHQSQEIGKWFREEGVDRITVSSLKMAQYFAEDGWQDITVAFPANVLEIDQINELAVSITLNLVVESAATVRSLENGLKSDINLYVKLDIGYHRTGVSPEDTALINDILDGVDQSKHIAMKGFLGHSGHSYAAKSKDEIAVIHHDSIGVIAKIKEKYIERYPDLQISVGDTPTCSVMDDFSMVDEIRPGNFVFYDLMQEQIGACSVNQITVAMACPVVAIHKERSEIIIYGGGVHFSKDLMKHSEYGTIFGLVVKNNKGSWGELVDGVYLAKISQEHGTVHATDDFIDMICIGDILKLLPIHSCMTADLHSSYLTVSGNEIPRLTH